VLAVVDPVTGTVEAAYSYDAFGKITQISGALSQPYGYTGREYDAESGLYYYRARTYDPAIGQFLQPDPIGFAAGDLNIYAYVSNNPYNWNDPSGLTTCRRGLDGTPECGAMVGGIITPGMVSAAVGIAAMLAMVSSHMSGSDSGDGSDDGDDGRPRMGHNGEPPDLGPLLATAAAALATAESHSINSPSSPGKMQRDVETGKAPRNVNRVDKGRGPYEKDHVHLRDGRALNNDGTWKHGNGEVSRKIAKWLEENGWEVP